MTKPGLERVLAFIRGVWPTAQLSRETVHAWRIKLQRFDDDDVMSVLFALSETEQYLPALSQVYQGCIDRQNRAAITADTQQRELTEFGSDPGDWRDRQWNALPPDEQGHWLAKAKAQWPAVLGDLVHDGSPIIRAHAAALARGVPMNALPPPAADQRPRCECGAVLLPGFDPPGPHCRNCQPKAKRATEMKR